MSGSLCCCEQIGLTTTHVTLPHILIAAIQTLHTQNILHHSHTLSSSSTPSCYRDRTKMHITFGLLLLLAVGLAPSLPTTQAKGKPTHRSSFAAWTKSSFFLCVCMCVCAYFLNSRVRRFCTVKLKVFRFYCDYFVAVVLFCSSMRFNYLQCDPRKQDESVYMIFRVGLACDH